jgi:DNA modification methylase
MQNVLTASTGESHPINLQHPPREEFSWQGTFVAGAAWRVLNGDAQTRLLELAPSSSNCVVTSPPYFWQRDYEVEGQIGLETSVNEYVAAICEVMQQVRRVLHKRGLLFLNLGDTYYSGKGQPQGEDRKHGGRRFKLIRAVDASGLGFPKKTAIGIPWRVAIAMIGFGWILRCPIIWQRQKGLPEANVRDRPWRTYETVFMFSKSRSYDFSRKSLKDGGVEDIWSIASRPEAGRQHPAAFPSELVQRCLRIGNPKSGLVLDPFAGSGTVLKVAGDLQMDSIGIELNKNYCMTMVANFKAEGRTSIIKPSTSS